MKGSEPSAEARKAMCRMRTGYYATHPDQMAAECVPLPAPHVFTSAYIAKTGEHTAFCSWCGLQEF